MVNPLRFIEKEMKAPGGEAVCQPAKHEEETPVAKHEKETRLAKHEGETGDLSQREAERQAWDPSFKMALRNSGVLQKPVGPGRQAGWGQQRSPRQRGS